MSNKNKIKYNLCSVHYSKLTIGVDDVPTYAIPIPIKGAVSLSMAAEGELSPFFADGIEYYTASSNNGYRGDLSVALIPDDFYKNILGEVEDEISKVIIENAKSKTSSFALLFQFDGDIKATRHVIYNCTCTRPGLESSTTTTTKNPSPETLTISGTPLENGMVKAKTQDTTTQEVYDNWFKTVWMPSTGVA